MWNKLDPLMKRRQTNIRATMGLDFMMPYVTNSKEITYRVTRGETMGLRMSWMDTSRMARKTQVANTMSKRTLMGTLISRTRTTP